MVHLSMAGDGDTDRHLGGVTADRVIGGDCWLARYRPGKPFALVYLPLHALLGRWCKCGYERPCCVVDICLCHHRVVLGVLAVMKGSLVLSRYPSNSPQAVDIKRRTITFRPLHPPLRITAAKPRTGL